MSTHIKVTSTAGRNLLLPIDKLFICDQEDGSVYLFYTEEDGWFVIEPFKYF